MARWLEEFDKGRHDLILIALLLSPWALWFLVKRRAWVRWYVARLICFIFGCNWRPYAGGWKGSLAGSWCKRCFRFETISADKFRQRFGQSFFHYRVHIFDKTHTIQ